MAKKKKGEEEDIEAEEKEEKPKEKDKGAEGGDTPEGEEGEAKPGMSKKRKLILFGALGVVILALIGAGVYIGFFYNKTEHAVEGEALGPDGKPINKPVFYTLPEFLVNLNSSTKQSSFLKTTIILELPKATDVVIVEMNLPRLTDAMNTYLRELRASDLAGSAGIQRLREELLLRANKALTPLQVNNVLFKEIVVQ